MSVGRRHIVLTGEPGVGKTTIVQSICEAVRSKGFTVRGFHTNERRLNGNRQGFDVVTLDGNRTSLASVRDQGGCNMRGKASVGRYVVDIPEFERCPKECSKILLVVDEIGKMELLSKKFENKIDELFSYQGNDYTILATIPVAKSPSINLIENIRKDPTVQLFEITRANRSFVGGDVLTAVCGCLS